MICNGSVLSVLFAGNGANSKSIYYFPLPLREFMAGDLDERVKCVSAGVKTLERKQKVCGYAIELFGFTFHYTFFLPNVWIFR